MPKKPHPADIADREKIANATHFNVHLRISPTEKINREARTLETAVEIADAISSDAAKPAIIYAVTPDRMAVFVTKDLVEAARRGDGLGAPAASKGARASRSGKEAVPAADAARRPSGKRAAILEAARGGDLPAAPDFSAETHKRFRPKLAKLIELAEAGDIAGLKAMEINPVSSSPKAMCRYRELCIIALAAKYTDANR
jgi:hypothetical protein